MLEIPDGGRINVRRADQPVRIARVHESTFGDRLVAKFGLPVRGFREVRRGGPGHELFTSRNVLSRDIITGAGPAAVDGGEVVAGEGRSAGTYEDA
jgi:NAD+ kinase